MKQTPISLQYLLPEPQNPDHRKRFLDLLLPYAAELDAHQGHSTSPEALTRWAESILARQGDPDRFLALCYKAADTALIAPVGFVYGKIDRPGDRGEIRPGWGYVMEFYVCPSARRQGCGRAMAAWLEAQFRACGVTHAHLTADPITGIPFWTALGYTETGRSKENGLAVFEKRLYP